MGRTKGKNLTSFRKLHKSNRKKGGVDRDLKEIEKLKEELFGTFPDLVGKTCDSK